MSQCSSSLIDMQGIAHKAWEHSTNPALDEKKLWGTQKAYHRFMESDLYSYESELETAADKELRLMFG